MTTNFTPPPFIEKFQYQSCKQINLEGKRLYQSPDGHKTPSVTTILDATKDKTGLLEWRNRVGHDKANQITKEAAGRGTAMHQNLERFLIGEQRQPGGNLVHVQANKMADIIIQQGLNKVSEIWAFEQSLYYPEVYSGTTDLVGVYDDQPAVMDYKQSNRLKKEAYVEDYYCQLLAYILAHNKVYGTDIKRGVIFMCTADLQYQQFNITKDNFNEYEDKWWDAVERYYRALL